MWINDAGGVDRCQRMRENLSIRCYADLRCGSAIRRKSMSIRAPSGIGFAFCLLKWKPLSTLTMHKNAQAIVFDQFEMLWPIEIASTQWPAGTVVSRYALDDQFTGGRERIIRYRDCAAAQCRVHCGLQFCARISGRLDDSRRVFEPHRLRGRFRCRASAKPRQLSCEKESGDRAHRGYRVRRMMRFSRNGDLCM